MSQALHESQHRLASYWSEENDFYHRKIDHSNTLRPSPNCAAGIRKRGFTLKTDQMFLVHTTPEEFENGPVNGHFGVAFEEKSGQCNMIMEMKSFTKSINFKMVFVRTNPCRRFQILPFRDGLVWREDITGKIKLHFQIPPV